MNSGFSRRLFFVWLACVAMATLAPFDFTVPPPGEGWEFTAFSQGSQQQEPIHFVLNMLLFVPLGILVHRGRARALALLTTFILVGSIGFLISFIVECVQRLLPGRESSLVDVAANTAGALVGVFTSRALGGDIGRCVKRWGASTPWLFLIAGSVSFMAVSLSALTPAAELPMMRFASV